MFFNVILVLLKLVHRERTRETSYAKKNYDGLVATRASIADISQASNQNKESTK